MTQIQRVNLDRVYAPWGPRAVSWLFDILILDLIWWAMDSLRAVVPSPLYRHFSDGPHYKVILGVGSSFS